MRWCRGKTNITHLTLGTHIVEYNEIARSALSLDYETSGALLSDYCKNSYIISTDHGPHSALTMHCCIQGGASEMTQQPGTCHVRNPNCGEASEKVCRN